MYPIYKDFENNYKKKTAQLVYKKLASDLETPVSVAMKLSDEPYLGLFESVEGGKNRGRYSFIILDPDMLWKVENGSAYISEAGNLKKFKKQQNDVFSSLRQVIALSEIKIPKELPSMASGIFGYMGYDMVRYMEKLPDSNPDVIGIPEAVMMRPRVVIIFDSVRDEMFIVTPVFAGDESAKIAYDEASIRITDIESRLNNYKRKITKTTPKALKYKSNMTREFYHDMVRKAKEYILAGDIFQVVPSQRFTVEFPYSAFELYRKLRRLNPSPYSFYLKMGDFSLVGSSPEILVRLKDEKVVVRPIAGTRKRGENAEEDAALAADLKADPKEISEHLMLIDLGRNDIGRVAKIGSVKVTENMVIEYYSHVMHIVSNVEGNINKGLDAVDALIAGFPVGTVSGAPKIRAMEIIDELETERRSFYAGGVGYFSSNGEADLCISLRTGLVKDDKLYVQAGGGVVADSDPEMEYQESCNKAKALLTAAEEVAKG